MYANIIFSLDHYKHNHIRDYRIATIQVNTHDENPLYQQNLFISFPLRIIVHKRKAEMTFDGKEVP